MLSHMQRIVKILEAVVLLSGHSGCMLAYSHQQQTPISEVQVCFGEIGCCLVSCKLICLHIATTTT